MIKAITLYIVLIILLLIAVAVLHTLFFPKFPIYHLFLFLAACHILYETYKD
jgi:hypothetical protein